MMLSKRIKHTSVSINQPCLFPYLGYYQLVYASSTFVIYDDVSYMKGKWINRNQIIVNNQPYMFTLPLANPGSNKLILDTFVDEVKFKYWKKKFFVTLKQSYSKSPYFDAAFNLVEKILEDDDGCISVFCRKSLSLVFDYLSIDTDIRPSSAVFGGNHLSRTHRLIHIAQCLDKSVYINPPGGRSLYKSSDFESHSIQLYFLDSRLPSYLQCNIRQKSFIPSLSMLDLLMNCSVSDICSMLDQYDLATQ
jgi:hypothetical protein